MSSRALSGIYSEHAFTEFCRAAAGRMLALIPALLSASFAADYFDPGTAGAALTAPAMRRHSIAARIDTSEGKQACTRK